MRSVSIGPDLANRCPALRLGLIGCRVVNAAAREIETAIVRTG